MGRELEVKFKVCDFRPVRRALRAAGGVYRGTVLETDLFFDTPQRAMYRSDRCLRLREVRLLKGAAGGRRGGWVLTYKGPRRKRSGLKLRRELQTYPPDGKALAEILRAAGWEVFLTLQKRRSSYRLGAALVELDELPLLGCFVEIEAPSARSIAGVSRKLHLTGEPITISYAHLALVACKKARRSGLKITF